MSKADFEAYVQGMPECERKVPIVCSDGKYYTPQEILDGWEEKDMKHAVSRAIGLILALRILREEKNIKNIYSGTSLDDEFIQRRIQVKYGLGMIAPFHILPGQRVEPKDLIEHVARKDRIGMLRIKAERELLKELSKPLSKGGCC